MNKTLLAVLGIAVLGGLFLYGGSRNASRSNGTAAVNQNQQIETTQAASLTDVPNFDFGSISMAKGTVAHRYQFTNTTGAPLMVSKVYTSCMCTNGYLQVNGKGELGPFGMPGHGFVPGIQETVAAGGTFEVKAVFDPAAHGPAGIGKIERQVIVETSAGQVEARFSATVTP